MFLVVVISPHHLLPYRFKRFFVSFMIPFSNLQSEIGCLFFSIFRIRGASAIFNEFNVIRLPVSFPSSYFDSLTMCSGRTMVVDDDDEATFHTLEPRAT